MEKSYVVLSLFVLIALLVIGSLLLVWLSLLLSQGLPSITEDLADLAYKGISGCSPRVRLDHLTKADAWVLITDILTLLVGKEHVCGKTTLWSIGIWSRR